MSDTKGTSWPVVTMTVQIKDMTMQFDSYSHGTGRITLIVHLADEIEGFPVEYELRSSCDFTGDGFQSALEAVMNHPVSLIRLCESPVETRFYLYSLGRIPNLRPQIDIGSYRVDFALMEKKIAIEIDGHEYHKTREQRTHDGQRERYLQLNGWRVIRFTGSEVYRNPTGCIDEVAKLIDVFETSSEDKISWSITPIPSDNRIQQLHSMVSDILESQGGG
jgi:very-short-patch-repair endonuclease